MGQKGFAPIPVFLAIAGLMFIAIGGFYMAHRSVLRKCVSQDLSSGCPGYSPSLIDYSLGKKVSSWATPSTTNETANWKTYTFNNEFSLQYPPAWKAEDMQEVCCSIVSNPAAAYPSHSEGALFIDGVYNESCDQALSSVKQLETTFAGNPAHITESQHSVNTIDENSPLANQKTIFVHRGKSCYTIVYSSITTNPSQKQIFDKILSTFKFFDPAVEGKRCGYLPVPGSGDDASCPTGYTCQYVNPQNDAGGVCVKEK